MLRRNPLLAWIGLIGMTMLAACNSGSTTGTGGGGGITLEQNTGTYQVVGNYIVSSEVRTRRSCNGTTLVDNSSTSVDSVAYELLGNNLTVYPSDFSDSLPSGAAVGFGLVFTGFNNSGLQGTWQVSDITYRVVSGTLTAQDQVMVSQALANIRLQFVGLLTIAFTATNMTATIDANTAQEFLDGDRYPPDPNDLNNVSVMATGKYTVQITGNVTSEVVTLTLSPNGDVHYSSSNTANAPYRYYRQPTNCPNLETPAWYDAFVTANVPTPTPLPKTAVPGPRRPLRSIF